MHAELPAERRGLSLACDVSDVAGLREMFSRLDRLDVLVNCAGIAGWTNVLEPSEETWDRVVDTNLKGMFFCSVEAARLMRSSGGGSIVNVSTVVAARGLRNLTPYAASKGGINALTIQLAARTLRHPRQRVRPRGDERGAQPHRRPGVRREVGAADPARPDRRAGGDGWPDRLLRLRRVLARDGSAALRRRRLDVGRKLPDSYVDRTRPMSDNNSRSDAS